MICFELEEILTAHRHMMSHWCLPHVTCQFLLIKWPHSCHRLCQPRLGSSWWRMISRVLRAGHCIGFELVTTPKQSLVGFQAMTSSHIKTSAFNSSPLISLSPKLDSANPILCVDRHWLSSQEEHSPTCVLRLCVGQQRVVSSKQC